MLLAEGRFGILPRRKRGFDNQPMICPQCRSVDCFRSHRSGAFDYLSTLLGLRPWRCHSCDLRFHASVVAVSFSGYAHCPRCGNFDLEHISADRVENGTLVTLKRWLAFPAYRCDPCRQRFFSALPFRRILPSTAPTATLRKAPTT
jgi:hypothetical protein